MTTETNGPATQAPPGGSSTIRTVIIGVLVALIFAAGGYLAGLIQGRAQTSAIEEELSNAQAEHETATAAATAAHDAELAAANAETEAARAQVEAARGQIALLETRRSMQHVADQLDARNFGTAEERLREADVALAALAERVPSVATLATEVHDTHIVVARDFQDQRALILGFATRLDAEIAGAAAASD